MKNERGYRNLMRLIGFNLKAYRTRKEETQAQMARRLDCSEKYYQALERGDKALSTRTLWKLAEKLECSVQDLLQIKLDS